MMFLILLLHFFVSPLRPAFLLTLFSGLTFRWGKSPWKEIADWVYKSQINEFPTLRLRAKCDSGWSLKERYQYISFSHLTKYCDYSLGSIHSNRKKWFQNICSIFCWMLTAGSDVFHFWPCEMLSCLCNALHIKCTNCYKGFSCLHKDKFLKTNVVQVSFTNAIYLLLFHGMRNAWYILLHFKCDTEKT